MQEAENLLLSRVRYHAQSNMKQWHSHSCSWCQLVPLHNHSLKVPNSNTNGKSLFFSFSQRQASHTHNPYLASTCWLAGCMGTAVSEVGKWSLGFFCTGYFLLPFSSSIGSGDCYRREEESKTAFWVTDSLMVLKTRMVKFALSRQNTLPNRH